MRKSKKIAAVMLELIQGEGGINVADQDFVREIFDLCNQNGVLTIVDECRQVSGAQKDICSPALRCYS
jgi:acetylornithine/succinyldiaminopimelate/putrescine aminotransferase